MVGRFFSGVGMLLRGFGFWGRRPAVMMLGLIPAAIVFVLIVAGLSTLAVNLAGSFGIGLVIAWFSARGAADARARVALTAGFLGGFTTYSAFAWETVVFLENRATASAALYVAGTVLGCLLTCGAGVWLGRTLAG